MEEIFKNVAGAERELGKLMDNPTEEQVREHASKAAIARLSLLRSHLEDYAAAKPTGNAGIPDEKYADVFKLIGELTNATHVMDLTEDEREEVLGRVEAIEEALDDLVMGGTSEDRAEVEAELLANVEVLMSEWSGSERLPDDYCGSCYGAAPAGECCNTCEQVRTAYRRRRWGMPDVRIVEQCRRDARRRAVHAADGEGCNLYGTMEVSRALGNFHIAPTTSAQKSPTGDQLANLQTLVYDDVRKFNVSHRINRLSFGDDYPGQVNPLDGATRTTSEGPSLSRYFVKVVPTTFERLNGEVIYSNQFSVTEYFRMVSEDDRVFRIPGLFFVYDLAPIKVTITEQRGQSFLRFFTRCAATIGGVFTVLGMLDKILYSSSKLVMKKMAMGKQG